ncbi:hypothetical protein GUITHDRAFT_43070, partial [Guillardia theta CCMP2712]
FLAFLQFVLIVLDRVLYLRRSIRVKTIVQLVTLLFFFSLLFMRMRQPWLTDNFAFILILYFFKCWYWIASAIQIRRGYPIMTGGNVFFRDFSFVNFVLYIAYSGTPFLHDMRSMLDWTCTATTLDFFQWMRMENIYAVLFQREVTLSYRRKLGRAFGFAQPWQIKLYTGVLYFAGLALVIWGPLLVSVVSSKYASPKTVPIIGVSMEIS